MLHLILAALLLLQALPRAEAFATIPTPKRPTRTRTSSIPQSDSATTALSATRLPSSIYPRSNGIQATTALPPAVSISLGPLKYSWYEDAGNAGFGRRVVYSESEDEEDVFTLEASNFVGSGRAKQHPFDDDDDLLYSLPRMGSSKSTQTEPKPALDEA